MASVNFEQADGRRVSVNIEGGQSLMEAALYGGVEGVDADCGGELACATCHVVIAPEWREQLPSPGSGEVDMLDFAVGVGPGSRLSCQIKLNESLDGLLAIVPASQR